DAEAMARLRAWARAGTAAGNHLWMQISHAGRQSPWYVTGEPMGPSAVQLKMLANYRRPRALREVVKAVRAAVGGDFPVALKLNSADFQQGGFTSEECLRVVQWLNVCTLDL